MPYVFEVRDLWPESAISTGVLTNNLIIKLSYWLESTSYKHAGLINVLTPVFKETLITEKGIPEDKIVYVPNAVDFTLAADSKKMKVPAIEQLREKYDLIGVYIGAHGVANHLDQLLDAAKILKGKRVAIVLIGDGMKKKKLMERAVEEQIDNLIFIDPMPKREVYGYIAQADVGISALQKNDTFKTIYSNKTFDYMACNVPIVMAIDGISRKLIE